MARKSQNRTSRQLIHRRSHWRESLMVAMQASSENSADAEINVGRRLQELRTMQGLSIRSLAEMSGLNFNTLSLIENQKTSPNVNTLQQLASALQVPITAFFETSPIHRDVVFQKSGQRSGTAFPHGELKDLGGGLALGEATPLLLSLEPNTSSGGDAIVHTGQEFVYCLEGKLVYWVGQEQYVLEPGDSLIFQAHIPHRWENREEFPSQSLLFICPSDHSDRSVEQHLTGIPQEGEG